MFWAFTLLVGLGFVFTKLGAYSVMVTLLSGALKLVALLLVLGIVKWTPLSRQIMP